jgi:hypothetical protein
MYNTNKGYLEEAKFSRGGYVLHIKGFVFDVVVTGSKSRLETAMSQSELARNWKQMATAGGPLYPLGAHICRLYRIYFVLMCRMSIEEVHTGAALLA